MAANEVSITVTSRDRTKAGFDDAEGRARGFRDSMGRIGAVAGGVLASGFVAGAGTAIAGFFTDAIAEAEEAEKVSRSTAQGIATMGAESWTSAGAVGDLSERISNLIGVDDELIQTSANMLLTFGNVKNAVGESNNVFDRALIATQDLAAKGFGTADSAAVMLGKALNDPIAGVTALQRVGVQFTEEQRNQIAAMVEANDMLGAQKIILGEVERQVGGTAEAIASESDKIKTRWGNIKEAFGERILPILEASVLPAFKQLSVWVDEVALPAFDSMVTWWEGAGGDRFKAAVGSAFGTIGTATTAAESDARDFHTVMGDFTKFIEGVNTATGYLNGFANEVNESGRRMNRAWVAAWDGIWGHVSQKLGNMLDGVAAFALGAINILERLPGGNAAVFDRMRQQVTTFRDNANATLGTVRDRVTIAADTQPARREVASFSTHLNNTFSKGYRVVITAKGTAQGDGPGAPPAGGGGRALATVRRAMAGIPGLSVTSTYRTPARNAAAGGSPRSYHMDRADPAADVAGPASALDRLHARLRQLPRRELLWRTKGHWDHLHFAHSGGTVSGGWPTLPGLRSDERPVIAQVGERILSRTQATQGAGGTVVNLLVQGSILAERDLVRVVRDEFLRGGFRGVVAAR